MALIEEELVLGFQDLLGTGVEFGGGEWVRDGQLDEVLLTTDRVGKRWVGDALFFGFLGSVCILCELRNICFTYIVTQIDSAFRVLAS
jgi:hypothetical protein